MSVKAIPAGYHSGTPSLVVQGTDKLIIQSGMLTT
jgi:hypothetical protein